MPRESGRDMCKTMDEIYQDNYKAEVPTRAFGMVR